MLIFISRLDPSSLKFNTPSKLNTASSEPDTSPLKPHISDSRLDTTSSGSKNKVEHHPSQPTVRQQNEESEKMSQSDMLEWSPKTSQPDMQKMEEMAKLDLLEWTPQASPKGSWAPFDLPTSFKNSWGPDIPEASSEVASSKVASSAAAAWGGTSTQYPTSSTDPTAPPTTTVEVITLITRATIMAKGTDVLAKLGNRHHDQKSLNTDMYQWLTRWEEVAVLPSDVKDKLHLWALAFSDWQLEAWVKKADDDREVFGFFDDKEVVCDENACDEYCDNMLEQMNAVAKKAPGWEALLNFFAAGSDSICKISYQFAMYSAKSAIIDATESRNAMEKEIQALREANNTAERIIENQKTTMAKMTEDVGNMVNKLDNMMISPRALKVTQRYYARAERRVKKSERETAVLRGLEMESEKDENENENEGKSSVPKLQRGCQCRGCRARKSPVEKPTEEKSASGWTSWDDYP